MIGGNARRYVARFLVNAVDPMRYGSWSAAVDASTDNAYGVVVCRYLYLVRRANEVYSAVECMDVGAQA